jgi:hypothetical protein
VGRFSKKPKRCSVQNCVDLYMVCQSGEGFGELFEIIKIRRKVFQENLEKYEKNI